MRIAVIGGGINGAGIAWELTRRGDQVVLFEKNEFGAATSSRTTKMIHGGLRYLEYFDFALVHEALLDRAFLLEHIPDLVKPLALLIPVYADSPRPAWMVQAGLTMYDILAGRRNIGWHHRLTRDEMRAIPSLRKENLRAAFRYWDAQVDDAELVRRVVCSATRDGLDARAHTEVTAILTNDGRAFVRSPAGEEVFDIVVNATGPWMGEWLEHNSISSDYGLSLVRGSHIVLDRWIATEGFLIQPADEKRVFFVLPWKGRTLVGTTEVFHRGSLDRITPAEVEIDYLLARFNQRFEPAATRDDIVESFAGVRPLIGKKADPGAISREYRIECDPPLVNVFGGKMTTFLSLSRGVADRIDAIAGVKRSPKPVSFAA